MLSSPASGNYLFHGGTVTSVYLGQTNMERIVTSPPFCLCLRRLSDSLLPHPRTEGRAVFAHRAHPEDAGMIKSLPTWQIPTPQTTAAPRKIHHPLSVGQGGRFAAGPRPGMAALQLDCSFISIEVEGETWVKHLQKGSEAISERSYDFPALGSPRSGASARRKRPELNQHFTGSAKSLPQEAKALH